MIDADDFDDETPPDALPGSASAASGDNELSEYLLEMLLAATRLHILLGELDEDAVAPLKGRVAQLKGLVALLPEEGRPAKRMGFKVTKKRRKRRS